MNRLFRSLGVAYPPGYRTSLLRLLNFSGSGDLPEVWLGKILFLNLLLLLALTPVFTAASGYYGGTLMLITLFAITAVAVQAAGYMWPYYMAGKRASSVEAVLPNFYQLMSSYLRSGMTPFQALKSASKKEFGILKAEIDTATSKALGTQSFSEALMGIVTRIRSESLKRSTELMVRGLDSGGSLASMLEESASNIIESRAMRREIIASTRTYTLMIVFAVLIGSPLLLSISTRFNERLIDMTSQIEGEGASAAGLQANVFSGAGMIAPDTLMLISAITVLGTAFISGLLVGIISKGNEKYGLIYSAIFMIVSLVLFLVFASLLKAVF